MNATQSCLSCGVGFDSVVPKNGKVPHRCPPCRSSRRRERHRRDMSRYRRENPEKFREIDRKRSQTPERRQYQLATQRRMRERRREEFREYQRQWRAKHAAHVRELAREWQNRRRALKQKTQVGWMTPVQVEQRMAMFGFKCWICGGPFEEVDHVKPLSRGGPHLLSNLRPTCRPCNRRKHNHWEGVHALSA